MNQIIENTKTKINRKIEKLKYNLLNTIQNEDPYYSEYTFFCNEHGTFKLFGWEIRIGKTCPDCLQINKTFHDFNNLDQEQKLRYLEEKTKYQYDHINGVKIELDNTIRPICKNHGVFLTTPRKLLENKDCCKWCDGIEMDEDGNSSYGLRREYFLTERAVLVENKQVNIKIVNPFKIIQTSYPEGKIIEKKLKEFKKDVKYKNYIQALKDPEKTNTIFFKINVTDRSTKFQFSIVDVYTLSPEFFNWYLEYLKTDSTVKDIQEYVANYIITQWFYSVFYNDAESNLSKKDLNFDFDISYFQWSTQYRAMLLAYQYKMDNLNKAIHLPSGIQNKIKGNFSPNASISWSENQWETTSTSISLIRESILKKTTTCPVCLKQIKDPVVDHEHRKKVRGTGRIRNNICSTCNVFIAKTENNCKRYKINLEELPQVLKNISDYFSEQQYNVIHYTEKDKRPQLKKSDAQRVLKYWEVLYPGKKKPKIPRSGVLTNDWEEYMKALGVYLANPYPTLTKTVYNKLIIAIQNYNEAVLEKIKNENIPKTRRPKTINIPDYPKLKVVTKEIDQLLKQFNL